MARGRVRSFTVHSALFFTLFLYQFLSPTFLVRPTDATQRGSGVEGSEPGFEREGGLVVAVAEVMAVALAQAL